MKHYKKWIRSPLDGYMELAQTILDIESNTQLIPSWWRDILEISNEYMRHRAKRSSQFHTIYVNNWSNK